MLLYQKGTFSKEKFGCNTVASKGRIDLVKALTVPDSFNAPVLLFQKINLLLLKYTVYDAPPFYSNDSIEGFQAGLHYEG